MIDSRTTHSLPDINNFTHEKKFLEDKQITILFSNIFFLYKIMKKKYKTELIASHLHLHTFQPNYAFNSTSINCLKLRNVLL